MEAMHMDAPSHYFFSLQRRNGWNMQQVSIRSCTKKMPEVFLTETCLFMRVSLRSSPTNSLRKSELQAAVLGLKSGKAPGIDCLPADFYKSFWSLIGGVVGDVLRDGPQGVNL